MCGWERGQRLDDRRQRGHRRGAHLARFYGDGAAQHPGQDFERPPGLVEMEICSDSGLLPTDLCPYRRQEIFIACPGQVCAPMQADTMQRISRTAALCSGPRPRHLPCIRLDKVFWVLPPEFLAGMGASACDIAQPSPLAEVAPYRRRLRLATVEVPHGPGRDITLASGVSLTLTSPDPARVYRLNSRARPWTHSRSRLPQSALPLRELTLTVNGRPLWQQQATYASAWVVIAGGRVHVPGHWDHNRGPSIQSAPITITVIGLLL